MADNEVQVDIVANATNFLATMQQAADGVKDFATQAVEHFGLLKGAIEGLAVADIVKNVAELEDKFGELAEQINRTSQMTGLTTDEVQQFNFAVTQTGGNSDSAASALLRLERNMSAAKDPTNAAALAFKAMGISATTAAGQTRPVQDVLNDLANYFNKTADGANKTALALQVGGRGFAQMIPLLDQGSAGLTKFNQELVETQSSMTGQQVESFEQYNQSLKLLGASWEGFKLAVATYFEPAAELVVNTLSTILHGVTAVISAVNDMTSALSKMGYGQYAPQNQTTQQENKPDAASPASQKQIEEAKKAADELLQIHKDANDQAYAMYVSNAQQVLSIDQESNAQQLALGRETNEQFLQNEGLYEQEAYQKEEEALEAKELISRNFYQQKLAMAEGDAAATAKIQEQSAKSYETFLQQQTALQNKFDLQKQKLDDKTAQDSIKNYKTAFDGINSAFDTTINHLLQGTETFQQAWTELAGNIAMVFVEMGEKMVAQWAWQELANLFASKTTGIGQVTTNASVAASAAIASTAAIPLVGPEAAPAAGAAAYSEAIAYLPSAAGGWDIPQDSLAMVHKKEMILPAELSDKIRNMTDSSQNNFAFNISAVDGASVKNMLMQHGSTIIDVINSQVRNLNPKAMAR